MVFRKVFIAGDNSLNEAEDNLADEWFLPQHKLLFEVKTVDELVAKGFRMQRKALASQREKWLVNYSKAISDLRHAERMMWACLACEIFKLLRTSSMLLLQSFKKKDCPLQILSIRWSTCLAAVDEENGLGEIVLVGSGLGIAMRAVRRSLQPEKNQPQNQ